MNGEEGNASRRAIQPVFKLYDMRRGCWTTSKREQKEREEWWIREMMELIELSIKEQEKKQNK